MVIAVMMIYGGGDGIKNMVFLIEPYMYLFCIALLGEEGSIQANRQ